MKFPERPEQLSAAAAGHDGIGTAGSPRESHAQVMGTLGVANELAGNPNAARSFSSWMAVSTSTSLYPDIAILEYARWASQNTRSFTLVVSDWVQNYNWAAEHDDGSGDDVGVVFEAEGQESGLGWGTFFTGKHTRELNRIAQRRIAGLVELFQEQGVNGEVVSWEQLLRRVVEESQENDVAGMVFLNDEYARLNETIAGNDEMRVAVAAVHRQRAPQLVKRFISKGQPAGFVHDTMQGYTVEEIFMTYLLAKTGWGTLKIGPERERIYDEISAKYIGPGYEKDSSEAPFGAVYLGLL